MCIHTFFQKRHVAAKCFKNFTKKTQNRKAVNDSHDCMTDLYAFVRALLWRHGLSLAQTMARTQWIALKGFYERRMRSSSM